MSLRIQPFTSLRFKVGKNERTLKLKVLNMFCRSDKNPVVGFRSSHSADRRDKLAAQSICDRGPRRSQVPES